MTVHQAVLLLQEQPAGFKALSVPIHKHVKSISCFLSPIYDYALCTFMLKACDFQFV